jgi:hypothetical protein
MEIIDAQVEAALHAEVVLMALLRRAVVTLPSRAEVGALALRAEAAMVELPLHAEDSPRRAVEAACSREPL